MRILVTGGCGYKGAVLVPKLLDAGHEVRVLDTEWFGRPVSAGAETINWDVRNGLPILPERRVDCIIHLAGVANDPCGNLAPSLTWEVGAYGTAVLADAAVRAGVGHFIFASSASVYGIKDEERVTEDLSCVPVSVYNRAKLAAERILLSHADRMAVTIVRPATVCGLSPNQRLDLVVNTFTMMALNRGRISCLGLDQYRPNIHIEDLTDLYCWLVDRPQITGVFNAGHENLTVREIAEMVAERTNADLEFKPTNDPRSYRLCSDKLAEEGWKPSRTVRQAIDEMVMAHNEGRLIESDEMSRVGWMRREGIGNS